MQILRLTLSSLCSDKALFVILVETFKFACKRALHTQILSMQGLHMSQPRNKSLLKFNILGSS